MSFEYYEDTDELYITINVDKIEETDEILPNLLVDFRHEKGAQIIIGFEILDFKKMLYDLDSSKFSYQNGPNGDGTVMLTDDEAFKRSECTHHDYPPLTIWHINGKWTALTILEHKS